MSWILDTSNIYYEAIGCLNLIENVDILVLAGNQFGRVQAASSKPPSVYYGSNAGSVFKDFAILFVSVPYDHKAGITLWPGWWSLGEFSSQNL